MPPPSSSPKLSLSKLAMYIVAAVAIFLVLRFVFSVAMSVLKFVALGALVLLVIWYFTTKGGSGKKSD